MIEIEEKWHETDLDRLQWEIKLFCKTNGYSVPLMHHEGIEEHPEDILIVETTTKGIFFLELFCYLKTKFVHLESFDLSPAGFEGMTGLVLPPKTAAFMVQI
jgi:hypothetical protein